MNQEISNKADKDFEGRMAIWKAINLAAEMVGARFNINCVLSDNQLINSSKIPNVFTWQLVEALCLLCLLLKSDKVIADKLNILGKAGPITIHENDAVNYVWIQYYVSDANSGLNAKPDLIVTSSDSKPNKNNIIRIIEVKCINNLYAPTIRSEFGKAYDLRVTNYLIWSYYTPSKKVIEGAKQLGLDLETIGFDSDQSGILMKDPYALIGKISYVQESVSQMRHFAKLITSANSEIDKKLLL